MNDEFETFNNFPELLKSLGFKLFQTPADVGDVPADGPSELNEVRATWHKEKIDTGIVLYVDLPGCRRDQISNEVVKNTIKFKAIRTFEHAGRQITYSGAYTFSDKYDLNSAQAKYDNGVLEIFVPLFKPEPAQPRKIQIA